MNHQVAPPPLSACEPPPVTRTRARLATGVFALLLSLLGLWMLLDLQRYPCEHAFHHGIDSPVLAVELASNANELKTAISPACPVEAQKLAISVLRRNTVGDCFFIPLYALFVWSFGSLFSLRADGSRMSLSRVLAAILILTALADYVEDIGIFRSLALGPADAIAQFTCWPSRGKWILLGAALVLTAVILVRSENPIYSLATRRLFSIAYIVSGALLIAGVWLPVLIGLAMGLFSLIVLFQVFALLGPYVAGWIPADTPIYEDDFCERKKIKKADLAVHE
jgi:hypothetical protein